MDENADASAVDVERVANDEVVDAVVDGIIDATGIDADGIDVDGIAVDGNDDFGIVAPPRNASIRAVREATPGNSCG